MTIILRAFLVASIALTAACSPPASTCSPVGIVVVCHCADERTGTAICTSEGLTTCECSDDAGPVDASPFDADLDGGVGDAGEPFDGDLPDAVFPPDGGIDGSPDASMPPPFPHEWDGTMPTDGVCSVEGWCWVYPRVPDLGYVDVSASGPSDVWALGGDYGAILHYDGVEWTGILHGIENAIHISAAAADSVWILTSDNQIHRYDGSSWNATTVPTVASLRNIWARTATDVWAVGDLGTVLHWDGSAWSIVDAGFGSLVDLRVVHGSSDNDVWAGGLGGSVRHFDGTSWSDRSVAGDVIALWVTSPTDAWAGGASLVHWTGAGWSVPPGRTTANITEIGGSPSGRLLILGSSLSWTWTGTTVGYATDLTGTSELGARSAVAYDDQFIVAASSPDRSSSTWTLAHTATGSSGLVPLHDRPQGVPRSLLVLGDDELLMTTTTTAFSGSFESGFTAQPTLAGHGVPSAADGIGDVWTLDTMAGYVGHWDGSAWSRSAIAPGSAVRQVAITGAGVWAIAGSQLHRFVGGTWSPEAGRSAASLLVPGGDSSLYVIGPDEVARFDGSWSVLPPHPPHVADSVLAGGAPSANDVSFHNAETLVHFDGTTWTLSERIPAHAAAFSGNTCWALAQELGHGLTTESAYWDGNAWYQAATYVDGAIRRTDMSVVRDDTGRTWALFGPGRANAAVLEWR